MTNGEDFLKLTVVQATKRRDQPEAGEAGYFVKEEERYEWCLLE